MKTLITFLLFLGLLTSASAQDSVTIVSDLNKLRLPTYGQKLTIVTTNTVPQRLSTTNLWVRRVTLLGMKQWRTNNTSTVWLGVTSTNNQQAFKILTGTEAKIEAPVGCKINLYSWWIDVETDLDGVVMIYDSF